MNVDFRRIEYPLLTAAPAELPAIKARDLVFSPCLKSHAVELTRLWHSRLPNTQDGPWMFAFKMSYQNVTYAVALWNNPSARTLPGDWLELRRMACAPDAPYNTPSKFISEMVRYFEKHCPEITKVISYQDTKVHHGTIYKASNWHIGYIGRDRVRDRSKPRKGQNRMYRWNINGGDVDATGKVRWEYDLGGKK